MTLCPWGSHAKPDPEHVLLRLGPVLATHPQEGWVVTEGRTLPLAVEDEEPIPAPHPPRTHCDTVGRGNKDEAPPEGVSTLSTRLWSPVSPHHGRGDSSLSLL